MSVPSFIALDEDFPVIESSENDSIDAKAGTYFACLGKISRGKSKAGNSFTKLDFVLISKKNGEEMNPLIPIIKIPDDKTVPMAGFGDLNPEVHGQFFNIHSENIWDDVSWIKPAGQGFSKFRARVLATKFNAIDSNNQIDINLFVRNIGQCCQFILEKKGDFYNMKIDSLESIPLKISTESLEKFYDFIETQKSAKSKPKSTLEPPPF